MTDEEVNSLNRMFSTIGNLYAARTPESIKEAETLVAWLEIKLCSKDIEDVKFKEIKE